MNKTPSPLYTLSVTVIKRLTEAGHRAFLAGGCVRDMLLEREAKDYDVATSATPEEVMKLFPKTVGVGISFGVICVIGERLTPDTPPLQVEVATFRSESGYSDGRHPDQIKFTTEVEDVQRRDFTINGLLFNPLTDEMVDHVGGVADLKRKQLRAIGEPLERFEEDHLRLLRAVRFSSSLGFEIEAQTLAAIQATASKINSVSAERVRDELSKMLTGPHPDRALTLMKETGLLQAILPDIAALEGVEQPPQFHPEGDVWIHTLGLLEGLSGASLTLALGALFHDVGKPATFVLDGDRIRFNEHDKVGTHMSADILKELRFKNETIERVTELVRHHMVFKDAQKMRPAKLKRFLRMPHFEEHLELHRLDCMACHGKLEAYNFCKEQVENLSQEVLRPEPLISGHDLMELGLARGPLFRKILTEIEDQQLEGLVTNREEALAYVRHNFCNDSQ